MNRLIRQLKREVKARPGKAALLGVLALIALGVVLARLRGTAGAGTAAGSSAQADLGAAAAPVASQAAGKTQLAWHELAVLLERSPAMQPVLAMASGGRDPFARAVVAAVEPATQDDQECATVEQTPSELGLKLTSTVIGPRQRKAVISGKVYEQGAQVPAGQEIVFELVEIHREHVVLMRGSRTYELRITRGAQSGSVFVRPAS